MYHHTSSIIIIIIISSNNTDVYIKQQRYTPEKCAREPALGCCRCRNREAAYSPAAPPAESAPDYPSTTLDQEGLFNVVPRWWCVGRGGGVIIKSYVAP